MVFAILAKTSASVAYTATAATLTTTLDTSRQPGDAVYQLAGTTALFWAQGITDTVFTASTNDECTATAHGLAPADAVQVSNSGGALPTGLSAATTYFAIVSDALGTGKFKLATSRANALAGTAIDITGAGTGTQTVTTVATTGAGSHLLPLGVVATLDGSNGPRVSVIRAAADGTASIAQLSAVR